MRGYREKKADQTRLFILPCPLCGASPTMEINHSDTGDTYRVVCSFKDCPESDFWQPAESVVAAIESWDCWASDFA